MPDSYNIVIEEAIEQVEVSILDYIEQLPIVILESPETYVINLSVD